MSSKKLKMYAKAYKKCLRSCKLSKSKCKSKCKSPLLSLNLKLKKSKRRSSSRSKRPLNAYQKFVKKEYPKHKHLDRTERFKAISLKWKSLH